MHALLFAGGVGQRLWPISRKNTPKQFTPIIGPKSSLQLAVDRLQSLIPLSNIYISTNKRYLDILIKQFPQISRENFILEPVRRDLGAAVALAFCKLYNLGIRGPIMFQWADTYLQHDDALIKAISVGKKLIEDNPDRIIFMGEVPRFASENLGYIEHSEELGRIDGEPYYGFQSWVYRPKLAECKRMIEAGNFLWNSGYFVTTVEFVVSQYKILAPEIATLAEEIISYTGTDAEEQKTLELYSQMPIIHFDESFLMRLKPEQALILKVDLGWSDPGSLYGLKEALQASKGDNVTRGKVIAVETQDSLIFNEEPGKTVSVMGLDGIMVVNTNDVLLIIPKESVRHIKNLLEELERQGHLDVL
ncbi:MAG: sugar phosphate nucleotidyltransferase [Anaerolineales bacterium]